MPTRQDESETGMEIRLNKEQKIRIDDADDVYKIMRRILLRENKIGRGKEHFWVLGLSAERRILYIELTSLGTGNQVAIAPDEVFQLAVHKGAVQIILVHNHPSGNLKPSRDDIDITDKLLQAGRVIGKEVVDHFIISETSYFSFAVDGLLANLQVSSKYQIAYLEIERIRKEGESMGEERGLYQGAKQRTLEMAKVMKQDGLSLDVILKYTDLSLTELERL